MTLLDQIKTDREAGTPGPWAYEAHGDTIQYGVGVCHAISDIEMAFPLSGQVDSDVMVTDPVCVEVNCQTNARRIARVPDMEAALIAAGELAEIDTIEQMISDIFRDGGTNRDAAAYISAAFRGAIEVK